MARWRERVTQKPRCVEKGDFRATNGQKRLEIKALKANEMRAGEKVGRQ